MNQKRNAAMHHGGHHYEVSEDSIPDYFHAWKDGKYFGGGPALWACFKFCMPVEVFQTLTQKLGLTK